MRRITTLLALLALAGCCTDGVCPSADGGDTDAPVCGLEVIAGAEGVCVCDGIISDPIECTPCEGAQCWCPDGPPCQGCSMDGTDCYCSGVLADRGVCG